MFHEIWQRYIKIKIRFNLPKVFWQEDRTQLKLIFKIVKSMILYNIINILYYIKFLNG